MQTLEAKFEVNDYIQRTIDLIDGKFNKEREHLLIIDIDYSLIHLHWRYICKVIRKQDDNLPDITRFHVDTANKYFTKIN